MMRWRYKIIPDS